MLQDSLKLMEYRAKRAQENHNNIEIMRNEIEEERRIIEVMALNIIKKDYPTLVREYKKGNISYKDLLIFYNNIEQWLDI